MELIYLVHILARHIWKILIISLLIFVGTFAYVQYVMPPEYKNTIVFSTTTKVDPTRLIDANYDPLSYFESADRFAEAILGWFRSPILFEDLKTRAPNAKDLPLEALIKVRKQEKQNINVLFSVSNRALADEIGGALITYLKDRVANVNEASNSSYDLIEFRSTVEETRQSALLTAVMAGGVSFALLCILFLLIDVLRGVVLYPQQAEDMLGTKSMGNLKNKDDLAALAALVAKQNVPATVLYTWETKHSSAIALGEQTSGDLGKKTLVIDGAKHSKLLLEQAGVSSRLAKVKGFFDKLTAEELLHVAMPLVSDQPLLRFIGSGEGTLPANAHLDALKQSNDVVILHTTLPENPYILTEDNTTLIIVVKPGTTSQKTLAHIARISGAARILFFA